MKTKSRRQLGKALNKAALSFGLLFTLGITWGWIYVIFRNNFLSNPVFWLGALTGTVAGFSFYRNVVDWREFKVNFIFVIAISSLISSSIPWFKPAFAGLWGQEVVILFWISLYDFIKHNGEVGIETDSPSFLYASKSCARLLPFFLTGFTTILVWETEFYLHVVFWASILVAFVFAWLYLKLVCNAWIKLLFRFVIAFGPLFLYAPRSSNLQYMGFTGIIWVVIMSWMESIRLGSAPSKQFKEVLPTYLPEGFREQDRERRKVKSYEIMEVVFGHQESDSLIWLKEANGYIPDTKSRKKALISIKKMVDVEVSIAYESAKRTKRGRGSVTSDFIEANWSQKSMNFNLRALGISQSDFEQIIVSIISQV